MRLNLTMNTQATMLKLHSIDGGPSPAPPTPGEYPAWSSAVTQAISGIYHLIELAAEEIEALKARVAQLEPGGAADAPPQENNE